MRDNLSYINYIALRLIRSKCNLNNSNLYYSRDFEGCEATLILDGKETDICSARVSYAGGKFERNNY